RAYLRDIHKLISKNIPVISEHPFVTESPFRNTAPGTQPTSVRTYGNPEPKIRLQRPVLYRNN
ncbi:MAG: hypothetical protein ACXWCT_16270, partial [Flavitalea sp.]